MEPQKSKKTPSFQPALITYLQCDKGGLHDGQKVHMVCLDVTCFDNPVGCSQCIQEIHDGHEVKPIKKIMMDAQKYLPSTKYPKVDADTKVSSDTDTKVSSDADTKVSSDADTKVSSDADTKVSSDAKIDADALIEMMYKSHERTKKAFDVMRSKILHSLEDVQRLINIYYTSISQRVKIKTSDPCALLTDIYSFMTKPSCFQQLKSNVQKILSIIPIKNCIHMDFEPVQKQFIEELHQQDQAFMVNMQKSLEQVYGKLNNTNKYLSEEVQQQKIWGISDRFVFSHIYKHQDVHNIDQNAIRCLNTNGYKLALMEPSVQRGQKIKQINFQIVQSSNQISLGLGLCHRRIAQANQFTFNIHQLNHGAYLAGHTRWVHGNQKQNSQTINFSYNAGDIIEMTVNLENNQLKLYNRRSSKYCLFNFKTIPGDELYPCVLFRFQSFDEVKCIIRNSI